MRSKLFLKYPIITLLFIFLLGGSFSHAETIKELNDKINEQRNFIEQINKEIAEKQAELLKVGAEKSTIQAAINQLEASRKKVEADLKLTEKKITTAELTIEKLSLQIGDKESQIINGTKALGASLRKINESEDRTLLETMLSNDNISSVWNVIENLTRFQTNIRDHMDELRGNKKQLEGHVVETAAMKSQLVNFQKELSGQKQSLEATKQEKNVILTQTQNKEAEYQRLLAEKQAQKDAFEKELFSYEAQLKIAIDPASFPTAQSSILAWPLDNIRITQYFGKTADSKRLYTSGTHNGVDFGVPDGTPIKAALAGVVDGVGNTDGNGCYSYGKWVLIKHANGLSTMYAHMSSQNVVVGDKVSTGQVIGYSGRTGYATGPHLHFTVYASQGVQVAQYTSSINCKTKTIPLADQKAYLDPMLYLPNL